jgi:small ligand-binding sensory domain FIST
MGSSKDSRAAPFACAHAAHEDWQAALKQCLAQLGAAAGRAPPAGVERLGLLYITEHYAAHAAALLDALQRATQVRHWAGCSAVGVAASGVELFDRPGMTLMLCELPQGSFQVFSGAQPLRRFPAHTALVHADPGTPGGDELIVDLAERCATGYLFGGVASGRQQVLQVADGAHVGGLSGWRSTRASS